MAISRIRALALAALAAALALLAYTNALHGPFTFDDSHEVLANSSITDLRHPLAIVRANPTRPLLFLSYAIDYARGGLDVFGFHLTNVLIHAVNVLLLFVLVKQLAGGGAEPDTRDSLRADAAAFLAAGLFAVHPLMTESVSYVSGRSELLASTFVLMSLVAFRRGFDGDSRWLAAGFVSFLLGLGSKETAVMLPFVLLASDVLVKSRSDWKTRLWRIHVPLLGVVFLAAAFRTWRYITLEQSAGVGAPFTWSHVAGQAHVIVRYISLLFLPISQSIVPAVSPIVSIRDSRLAIAVVSLVALGSLALWARNRVPLLTFGLVWFLLALVPSSALSLPEKIVQPMAEHRVYLASGGFFLAVAALTVWLTGAFAEPARSRPAIFAIGTIGVLAALLTLTIFRNRLWADPVKLWEDAARKAPDIYAAQAGLGYEQWLAGNCDLARATYVRAMELRPTESDPYVVSADCFLAVGRIRDAEAMLRLGVIQAPEAVNVRLVLAALEETRFQRFGEALRLCREVLAIEPGSEAAKDCVHRNEGK